MLYLDLFRKDYYNRKGNLALLFTLIMFYCVVTAVMVTNNIFNATSFPMPYCPRHYPRVSRLTDSLSHTGRHNTDLFHLPALSARVHPAATNGRFGCDFRI